MGSLRNTDFGALWASWAGVFRLGEPVLGTGSGFRWVPTGFAVPRFRFRRLRETEVSGVSVFDGFQGVRFCSRGFDGTVSGNRVPGIRGIKKVPGQGFRQLLCTAKVYSCTLKVYFCTLKVYLLFFASILSTLKVCFRALKASFCT